MLLRMQWSSSSCTWTSITPPGSRLKVLAKEQQADWSPPQTAEEFVWTRCLGEAYTAIAAIARFSKVKAESGSSRRASGLTAFCHVKKLLTVHPENCSKRAAPMHCLHFAMQNANSATSTGASKPGIPRWPSMTWCTVQGGKGITQDVQPCDAGYCMPTLHQ